jgi:aspartate aminotransferase-like enzyme
MDYPKRKLIMLPGPTNVPDRVMAAMMKPIINHRGETFTTLLKEVTEKSKQLFQTTESPLILNASGTGGVEAAIWNIVRPGDRVLVPVFGEFSTRLAEAVELAGGEVVRVTSEFGTVPSLEAVEEAARKTSNLKAIYIVHNETSTGCAVPYVEQLGRIAGELGAFYIVDAISSLGGYAIPVDAWAVDICVTGSQKCLAAPPGLALLSMSKKASDYVRRDPPRVRYFDLARQLEFLSRGETPFTPAISLYYALNEALDMLVEEGLQERVKRHARHALTFYSAIEAMGLGAFAQPEVRSNTVIAGLYPDGLDGKQFRKRMNEEHDIIIGAGFGALKSKMFRIGNMGEVNGAHVNRTAAAMALTLTKAGHQVDMRRLAAVLEASS